jgi:hypothetical protein
MMFSKQQNLLFIMNIENFKDWKLLLLFNTDEEKH